MIMKNKITILIFTASLLFSGIFFTSCEDMLTTDSDLVIFVEDNKINSANDSIYSVIGIINLMQKVADKTILLGEMRADLSTPTQDASTDLKAIADFTADIENKYNKPQEFYAIINNCNYFIATADSAYSIKNQSIFAKELGVVKTFRAWAYMQLCQIYGEVPFYTDPILTEAQAAKNYPKRDMKFICDYFISELEPYKDIETPGYGSIGSYDSKRFYIPIRVLLGEMCLW